MDTYDAHCGKHGTYPLNPSLKGCPICKIDALELEIKRLRVWMSHDQLRAVERLEEIRKLRLKEEYI